MIGNFVSRQKLNSRTEWISIFCICFTINAFGDIDKIIPQFADQSLSDSVTFPVLQCMHGHAGMAVFSGPRVITHGPFQRPALGGL